MWTQVQLNICPLNLPTDEGPVQGCNWHNTLPVYFTANFNNHVVWQTDLCVLLPVSECWWVRCVEQRPLDKRRVYFQVHITVIIIVIIIIIFTAVMFTILPSTCERIRHWRCETSLQSKQYPTFHTVIAPIWHIYSPSKSHKQKFLSCVILAITSQLFPPKILLWCWEPLTTTQQQVCTM